MASPQVFNRTIRVCTEKGGMPLLFVLIWGGVVWGPHLQDWGLVLGTWGRSLCLAMPGCKAGAQLSPTLSLWGSEAAGPPVQSLHGSVCWGLDTEFLFSEREKGMSVESHTRPVVPQNHYCNTPLQGPQFKGFS